MASTNYLRPYIPPEEMEVLIILLKEKNERNNGLSRLEHSIFHRLSKLWTNSVNGLTKPVVLTRENTLREKLELDAPIRKEIELTTDKKMERAYHKWVNMPGLCTMEEVELAQDHRYTNGLMSEDERDKYENDRGINFNF